MEDYSEEEFLVYVELDSQHLTADHLRDAHKIKMFGVDTKSPLLQINNLFFQGKQNSHSKLLLNYSYLYDTFIGNYDYSMGTHLFYRKNDEIPVDDLYSKCESYYENVAKTNKVLKMNRVVLKRKQDGEDVEETQEPISVEEELIKSDTYENALARLLRPGREAPRRIVEENEVEEVNKGTESMEIDDK